MSNIIQSNNDELDIKDLCKILFFNKRIISSIALLFFLLGIVFSFTRKKVYQGEIQIVLDLSSNQNSSDSFEVYGFPILNDSSQKLETEIGILKSPLVLSEVYSFVNASRNDKNSLQNLTFKKWLKKNLKIELEKGTSILNLYYKDYDKAIILPVLNQISDKYQEYSKRDRNIEILRTLEYLDSQKKIMEKQSQNSFSAFNKFSIENGLGSRDNFVGFDFGENNVKEDNQNNISLSFNQKYESQFKMLEVYESQYMDLSSSLKSNSPYLIDLKNKIDNLRNSLKKPNEILIKYNELRKIAIRDNFLFNEINLNLEKIKLEQAKKPSSWELITNPTLNQYPIAPRKKLITIAFTLSGLIIGSIFVVFREKLKGVIYSSNDLNSQINLPFISELSINDKFEITEIFFVILKSCINSNEKIGLLSIGNIKDNIVLDLLKIVHEKFNQINITFFESLEKTDNIDKLILVGAFKLTTKNEINKTLRRLEVLEKKSLGLIILKDIDK